MTKTPEEMAHEKAYELGSNNIEFGVAKDAFLAGYKAAKDYRGNISNEYRQKHYSNEMNILRRICAPNDCIERLEDYVFDLEEAVNSSNNSNGWISVKERLPEIGVYVLVTHRTSEDHTNLKVMKAMRINDEEYELSGDYAILANYVDYWMPLPEAPKDE